MSSSFLLSYVNFDHNYKPFIDIQTATDIIRKPIVGEKLMLDFDLSQRYCTGWIDFEEKCAKPCPDRSVVDSKYDSCVVCNKKTGFNPAFYHAKTISERQTKINQQPHFVYVAYFAHDLLKVGITQESRGIKRLLEQGARMALKLETFPSANIARQYEEKIARQTKLVETVSGNKKLQLIKKTFEPDLASQKLLEVQKVIEKTLSVEFPTAELVELNKYYYNENIDHTTAVHIPGLTQVVGTVAAMIGPLLITKLDSTFLAYNLKNFVGYKASLLASEPDIELPSEQLALF